MANAVDVGASAICEPNQDTDDHSRDAGVNVLARLRELCRQETGQDLVEYALLALFVVLASVAMWQGIASAIGTAYRGYDGGVQGLWAPCDPGVTPPC